MSKFARHIHTIVHSKFTPVDKILATLNIAVFLTLVGLITHISPAKDPLPKTAKVQASTITQYPSSVPSLTPTHVLATNQIVSATVTLTPQPTRIPTVSMSTPTPSSKSPSPTITSVPSTTPSVTSTQSTQSLTHATSQSLLDALNSYRQKKGKHPLSVDQNLASFAQGRADSFAQNGSLDNHAGFQSMMNDNGFEKMGFWSLGENSGWSDNTDPVHIIESLYGGHGPHDENQLESKWSHVGIGVNGSATNFVFGGSKR